MSEGQEITESDYYANDGEAPLSKQPPGENPYTSLKLQTLTAETIYDDPSAATTPIKTSFTNLAPDIPPKKTAASETDNRLSLSKAECSKKYFVTFVVCQVVLVVILVVAVAVAIAGLVLANQRCDCTAAQGELATEVQELQAMLASLTGDVATINSSLTNQTSGAMTSPQLPDVITYTPFLNCTTATEASCDIAPSGSMTAMSSLCVTPARPLILPGMTTTDVQCGYAEGSNFDPNPLVATPSVVNGGTDVQCLCAVVTANGGDPQTVTVSCGLRITRCPTQQQTNL